MLCKWLPVPQSISDPKNGLHNNFSSTPQLCVARFLAEIARAWGGEPDEFDDVTDDEASSDAPLTLSHVEDAYAALVRKLRVSVKRKNLADFLTGTQGEKYREGSLAGTEFAHQKGLAAIAPAMLMNGKVHPVVPSEISATIVQAIQVRFSSPKNIP